MKMRLALICFICAVCLSTLAAQIVDTTVCDVLANPSSFDGKIVRIKGTVLAGLDEFVIKNAFCGQAVNGIWLAYPEGANAKAGAAAFVQIQLAKNNPAAATVPNRVSVKLDANNDFKQFDTALSAPHASGGMCLGCVRSTVTATVTGRLDGAKSTGVVRDPAGKFVAVDGFGNLNRYSARLVVQSVSDVSVQEIDYTKNAGAAKKDSQNEKAGGDPVEAAHHAAQAFGADNPAGKQIERAAAAFGNKGEHNGVEVGFGVSNEVPKNDSPKGQQDSPDGLLFNCTFDMDRLKGEALTRAIVHVGNHVADVRDPQVPTSTTLFRMESDAWRITVLSAVASGQKTLTMPGGYLGWNSAWSQAERGKAASDAIIRLLSEWSLLADAAKQ